MTRTLRWRVLVLQVGLTGILAFVAGFLFWANSFTHDMVGSQLSSQQITFPKDGDKGFTPAALGTAQYEAMHQYAGQPLTTGPQAQVYADDYIGVHLKNVANGMTYSQASAASMANPSDTKMAAAVQTLFRGETLRGLLLNGYGWWQVGQYAFYAAIGMVVAATAVFTALAFEVSAWALAVRRARVAATAKVGETVPSAS